MAGAEMIRERLGPENCGSGIARVLRSCLRPAQRREADRAAVSLRAQPGLFWLVEGRPQLIPSSETGFRHARGSS